MKKAQCLGKADWDGSSGDEKHLLYTDLFCSQTALHLKQGSMSTIQSDVKNLRVI